MEEKSWWDRNSAFIAIVLVAFMISAIIHSISWQIMAQKIANYTQTLQDENEELKKKINYIESLKVENEKLKKQLEE